MDNLLENKQLAFVHKLVSNSLKLNTEEDREEFLSAYNIIFESREAYVRRYDEFREDVEKNSTILTNLYLHAVLSFFIRLVIIVALGYAIYIMFPNAHLIVTLGIPTIISLLLISDNIFDTLTHINRNSGYVKLKNRKMFITLSILDIIESFMENLGDTQVKWLLESRYKEFDEEFRIATKTSADSTEEE